MTKESNILIKETAIFCVIIELIILIISTALTIFLNDNGYIYGFLICFIAPFLGIFLSWYLPNKVIDLTISKKINKASKPLMALTFFFKYLLILAPLLIGQIINVYAFDKDFVFNPWIMTTVTLSYPLCIFYMQFAYSKLNKKIKEEKND